MNTIDNKLSEENQNSFVLAIATLAEKLALPVGILCAFSGFIAAIFLAFKGEWNFIGYGAILLFISIFGLTSALMLGMFIAGPAAAFGKKGMRLGFYIFGCLNAFYTMTVLSVWCIFVFNLFSNMESGTYILPPLLWANAVAIIPVLGISHKDLQSGNSFTMIAAFFAEAAGIFVITTSFFSRLTPEIISLIFALTMLPAFFIQARLAAIEIRPMAKRK
jgi:hypothetical protein